MGAVVGFIAFGLLQWGMARTNALPFCVSCHSMTFPYAEYKQSPHYRNPSGARAECSDCHVPHDKDFDGWVDKLTAKVLAAKDVYHEILGSIDSREKFEAKRWVMANRVWDKMKRRDSAECRHCHAWDAMLFAEQDRLASRRHRRAMEEGETCIDCHKGIAHEEPEEPEEPEKP
ncbi:putative nitrate/TMAO reductase, membrane-bound tetraheme cytochrome c subunit [Magnetofaba australis IT-1]|uniref:Cytochrome c-type protein n=1 Tax=Magnetofaba australis IT-1 TaxID=1434232 RepID=A0A1Y2K7B4_9PROT|nr:putative nitrate/TMAO reductase, membrane-bound tetraheme cytochrome c subunit [Magnetofaba australis IT-1]